MSFIKIILRRCSTSTSKLTSVNETLSKAERVLGFSNFQFSLKNFLGDYRTRFNPKLFDWINDQLHQLHPVYQVARKLDPNTDPNYKSRALLTLLLAKCAGVPNSNWLLDQNNARRLQNQVFEKQLILAEVTELLHCGCQLHSCGIAPLGNIRQLTPEHLKMIVDGNKLAFINGCYLLYSLATKCYIKLDNSEAIQIMTRSVVDVLYGEMHQIKIRDNMPKTTDDHILEKWLQTSYLKSASVLSSGCRATLLLAKHNKTTQEVGMKIGASVALAWHVREELEEFAKLNVKNYSDDDAKKLLLPLLLLMEKQNFSIYNDVDECLIQEVVEKTKALLNFYVDNTMDLLDYFEKSEAKELIKEMVKELKVE